MTDQPLVYFPRPRVRVFKAYNLSLGLRVATRTYIPFRKRTIFNFTCRGICGFRGLALLASRTFIYSIRISIILPGFTSGAEARFAFKIIFPMPLLQRESAQGTFIVFREERKDLRADRGEISSPELTSSLQESLNRLGLEKIC